MITGPTMTSKSSSRSSLKPQAMSKHAFSIFVSCTQLTAWIANGVDAGRSPSFGHLTFLSPSSEDNTPMRHPQARYAYSPRPILSVFEPFPRGDLTTCKWVRQRPALSNQSEGGCVFHIVYLQARKYNKRLLEKHTRSSHLSCQYGSASLIPALFMLDSRLSIATVMHNSST